MFSAEPYTRTPQRCPVLVLGLGNILLRDEGVGVRVIEELARRHLPDEVELCDGGTAGMGLLDTLAHRDRVIVVDAMAGSAEAGTVLRLDWEDLAPAASYSMSLHEVGLAETLAAARHLDIAPRQVVVFGVRPFDMHCGLELSPQMSALIPEIAALVLEEIEHCPSAVGLEVGEL